MIMITIMITIKIMITIMITIKMKAPQYHHYLHPQSLTDYSET